MGSKIIMLALLVNGDVRPFWVDRADCANAQASLHRGGRVEITLNDGVVVQADRIACVPLSEFIGLEVTQ